jgi:signal transduction histidine kinase
MMSLRRRLRRVLLVLAAGFLVQWLVADRMIVYVGESEMATRLAHDSDSLTATFRPAPDGTLAFDRDRAGVVYTRPYSGHYFVVAAERVTFHSASFGAAEPFRVENVDADLLTHAEGPQQQPLLVLHHPLDFEGRRVLVAVGEDLTQMREQLAQFRFVFVALSALVMLAAILLQDREIRQALLPLDRIRDAVLRIPEGEDAALDIRAPAEIQPLVDEINRLLAFVKRRLAQSRTAIGNLSHAVKTPLTAVFRLLEDPRLLPHEDLARALREQAEAIGERFDRELRRARLAGGQPTQAHFAPRDELPSLVELLQRIHAARALEIAWSAPAESVPYDRQDMMELLGNLGDNACKWARRRVDIEIAHGAGWTIRVADDGPGCAPEEIAQLGARGVRTDESRPGHGLGLAIVRDIVEHAGGSVELRNSPVLGGLEVVARLPGRG